MNKYEDFLTRVKKFNTDRDWEQFHSAENLAKSISIEAGELLECFQWNSNYNIDDVKDEMSDVFTYLIDLADELNIDLIDAANNKMDKNEKKYPVEKAKGSSKKYTEL